MTVGDPGLGTNAGTSRPENLPLVVCGPSGACNQFQSVKAAIESTIVAVKEYPHWGAPKIREKLRRLYPDLQCPTTSIVY